MALRRDFKRRNAALAVEVLGVRGTRHADDDVLRQRQVAALQVLLQARLGVLAELFGRGRGEDRLEEAEDHLLGSLKAAFGEHGAEDGLHGIGRDRGTMRTARLHLAFAHAKEGRDVDLFGDDREGPLADEVGAHARKVAFGEVLVALEERVAHDAVENRVAQEFEALVVLRREAAVRHRTFEKLAVGELVADALLKNRKILHFYSKRCLSDRVRSAEGADAGHVAKVRPDERGAADEARVINEAPVAAVLGVVAVVAHHEVLAFGDLADEARVRVRALGDLLQNGLRRNPGRTAAVDGDHVLDARKVLLALVERDVGVRVDEVDVAGLLLLDAVDVDDLVAVFDRVARNADDALDVVDRLVHRVLEDHDVAALRAAERNDLPVGDGEPDAVLVLVDEDEVAHVQRREHRARRNAERLEEEAAHEEDDRDHGEEARRVLEPPGLADLAGVEVVARVDHGLFAAIDRLAVVRLEAAGGLFGAGLAGGQEAAALKHPEDARDDRENEKDQRKVHQCLPFRSCGEAEVRRRTSALRRDYCSSC